jgi:hypothetical protein
MPATHMDGMGLAVGERMLLSGAVLKANSRRAGWMP